MDGAISVGAFIVFGVLWIAFAYAIVANQGGLDATWQWIGGLPMVAQVVVWLLFLPVVVGLWVWENAWPLVLRLVVVAGLGGATLWVFFPKFLFAR